MLAGCWCCYPVTTNRPQGPICAGHKKKNGTTSKGKTRWRCKDPSCGSSLTRHRSDKAQTRDFQAFYRYAVSTTPLTQLAGQLGASRWTLNRRFAPFWLIDIPNTPDPTVSTTSEVPHNENEADQQTGRPALYDNAIPTDYNHNLGVQKGWIGTQPQHGGSNPRHTFCRISPASLNIPKKCPHPLLSHIPHIPPTRAQRERPGTFRFPVFVLCGLRGSNPRPTGCKPVALPAELKPHPSVRGTGIP